ncbi:hypothetical protein M0208_05680 [Sphingomonas sp. SUN019]|uniref:hypothetical protein n=1 Tax=Sphingomonas sp. SUN019 TaxID=2937788 RepID=UPI00216475A4|nr:hypothetical protein [Sphingomonas sp. SUN019]UVO50034.1 hypothetical protein M0208_05680 [Sphingomonas sp. SUN019]
MSAAAAERAALAAIGQDLVELSRDAGERRAAALLGPVAEHPKGCFADLVAAPDWLRLPREEQTGIARRAALLAMAPAIDASIDGDWLGDLARLADETTLDWAIGLARDVPGAGIPAIVAADVEATGFALMRAALPTTLAAYLDWAPDNDTSVPSALAEFCVARAAEEAA